MKSTVITLINVFIIVFIHVFILKFLDETDTSGSCGIPSVIIAFIPLAVNFIWSCGTIYLVSKSAKKQYFDDTLLYVIIATTGNSLIAFFAESYLWALLIIPYLIFLGESFYLKFESQSE